MSQNDSDTWQAAARAFARERWALEHNGGRLQAEPHQERVRPAAAVAAERAADPIWRHQDAQREPWWW